METIKKVITGKQVLEAALLNHPLINDCVVIVRQGELVAYIVTSRTFSLEQLQAYLRDRVPAAMVPIAYVPVSTLPLTNLGVVDEQALANLEVIDSDLVQQWEEQLQSVPFVEQVAVIVQENNEKAPPLHLLDVLPNQKTPTIGKIVDSKIQHPAALPQEELESKTLAISYGELLQEEPNQPTTLSEALKRTAIEQPSNGIIYLKADGSEVVQSYEALLKEAEQILAGLRQLGLKPQDKVIFLLKENWNFIPAFWGCILGGFIPVPISIPPTYELTNTTVQKLHNAWQMLEHPLILTSAELAPTVRSLSEFGKDLFVRAIDSLRLYEPDRNWHVCQPDDLAVLFLTSGSTGVPRGVMLSHRNILSNVSAGAQMNAFTSVDISLNWLHLDHVGSLIRCSIRDIYVGSQQIHVPTEAVLEDPLRWLDWIDRYRVTFAWAPNFALGLVNAQAEVIQQRHWDLSAVKSVLSVAEAIVPKTAQRFWELLAPHGLSIDAMHSAWGMSETCAAVTFSHSYLSNLPSADYPFVEVGAPIPGLELRIVDAENQVVQEDVIGQLEIKGQMITCGYYQNPELNREAFTEDGWFKTGDLGFLRQGRLTIVGRQKDVIIINGRNHYSHEIEAIVEAVDGVEVSYTAAFGVRSLECNTDQLVIFFHTPLTDNNQLADLLYEIRKNVAQTGITPTYLIPVDKQTIPKTAIGKIQRSQLKQRFEAGEFASIVKQIDILSENANTLPNWFYKKNWRRKESVTFNQVQTSPFLIFLDKWGLGLRLCTELQRRATPYICVETGSEFAQLERSRYSLNPKNPDHYKQLLESLKADQIVIEQILHLWTYDKYRREISILEVLEEAQERGVYSLLFLVQAVSQIQGSETNVRLSVVSSHTQPVPNASEIAYENSPILGLIKTIPQELPWLDCRHIDLTAERVETDVIYVLREIQVIQKEREVAYRHGQRFVPRLVKVDPRQEQQQDLPFQQGGMYLLSGGLGEIGVEIAKYLLQHYQAKLLLVGRTRLPERSSWEEHIRQGDAVSSRIQAYLSLEQLGGEVIYEAVDICDLVQLQQVVERVQSGWQCELNGVVHLARITQERLLTEETKDSLAAMLRPKVSGTWALHQLVKEKPNCVFINFSSVASVFGAYNVGAYAAANSFIDAFSHYQKNNSLRSYCFAWSIWEEVGKSRGYQMRDLSRARGYYTIQSEQGLNSFLAGLSHDHEQLIVGLDGYNSYMRSYMEATFFHVQKLCAYFTAPDTHVSFAQLQELEVSDRFGTPSTCSFFQLQEMPLTDTGKIDREQLAVTKQRTHYVTPRTQLEQQLASIWQQVLNVPQVGIQDNFFELGGTSLLAVQLFSNIEQTFGKKLPLASLFPSGTVEALAKKILREDLALRSSVLTDLTQHKSKSWSSLVEIQTKGSRIPLFCIHPLGGEILCYRDLAIHLGCDQPVYGLQPIGLDGEPPLTTIEDMARHYIQEIKTIQPNGPYFLVGWSFGGIVCYEMAQQLHRQGEKVDFLGMIDSVRPGFYKRSPFLMRVFLHLSNMLQQGPTYIRQKLIGWTQHGKYHLQQQYKRYLNATQLVVNITENLTENGVYLKVIDANVQALDKYVFQVYKGSMTLFRTDDKSRDQAVGGQYDPQFGWGDLIASGIDIHYIPGSHISLVEEPHVQVLAEKLQGCLEKVYAITSC